MVASGSLAGGTGSWALLWAAVQACHMVRLGQAGHCMASQLLPQAPKDNRPTEVPLEAVPSWGVWRKLAAPKSSLPI